MVNDKKDKKKNDTRDIHMHIMLVQLAVGIAIMLLMVALVRTENKMVAGISERYDKLMQKDISAEDVSEVFGQVKEYAAAFAEKKETGNEKAVIGGGIDISFSELNALEGICLDEYTLDRKMTVPLKDYTITSEFGYRISPITGSKGGHTGLDMAAAYGSEIYAALDGKVVEARYDNSYGNYVKIDHGDNLVTIYAHCSSLCVSAGDEVKQGDVIAKVGSTGSSTGNHLHFEVRKDNIKIDPRYALFGK